MPNLIAVGQMVRACPTYGDPPEKNSVSHCRKKGFYDIGWRVPFKLNRRAAVEKLNSDLQSNQSINQSINIRLIMA